MILFFLRLKTKLKCFQQNVVIRRFQATYSILQKGFEFDKNAGNSSKLSGLLH